jgi:hypothetical protein
MSAVASLRTDVIPDPVDATQQFFQIYFTITLTGTYGGAASHGDTLDLSPILQAAPSGKVAFVVIDEAPAAGNAPTGYLFTYCPGTTVNNGVLSIFNNLTEYTQASAYSAGLLAAVIRGVATVSKFV